MSQDEFSKLFTYMERRFDRIEAELDKKADKADVYAALDSILKRLDTLDQERLAATASWTVMSVGLERLLARSRWRTTALS